MPALRPPRLNLDGYTDLPAGKIAAIVTYLEMRSRPRLRRLPAHGLSLERIDADLDRFRALFRAVGEPWMWFSRLAMPDERLRAVIGDPDVESYALVLDGSDIGLLELVFRVEGECEIAYIGLVPDAIGRGAGRYLMNEAIRRAFRRKVGRLWLHTCSLDHPGALDFYRRSGFVPYRRAVEVADDPRLTGALPVGAAPHVPVIGVSVKGRRRVAARPGSRRPRPTRAGRRET